MRITPPDTEAVPDCCRKGLYSCLLPSGLFALLCLAWPGVVNGAGGLFLLMGILLLKSAGFSMTLSALSESADGIQNHALYPAVFICFMVGAMTKSGQVPFHFWLPNAMSAPTPISAFLHAATMVKAGIYLLMRLHPVMGGTPLWMSTLVLVGGATALWGAIQALGPCDLKRILAHTTLMALGVLTLFLGGQTVLSLTAATTFLMVHALYKAALFLAAGSIDHATGTRDLNHLGGLATRMPLTALARFIERAQGRKPDGPDPGHPLTPPSSKKKHP
jgi:multicomponent Na+:H+ antiporter subunit A